jgi:hypothetical protein
MLSAICGSVRLPAHAKPSRCVANFVQDAQAIVSTEVFLSFREGTRNPRSASAADPPSRQ